MEESGQKDLLEAGGVDVQKVIRSDRTSWKHEVLMYRKFYDARRRGSGFWISQFSEINSLDPRYDGCVIFCFFILVSKKI